jgi:hypothetical protein
MRACSQNISSDRRAGFNLGAFYSSNSVELSLKHSKSDQGNTHDEKGSIQRQELNAMPEYRADKNQSQKTYEPS